MINTHSIFPAKILLFGEYTLITGSTGLAIPFDRFHASFEKTDNLQTLDSAFQLNDLCNYLKSSKILSESMDLEQFNHDINQGLYLNSTIPRGYGIGSSGALCAAVYAHYSHDFKRKETYSSDELNHFKDVMALMENFYHGTSSGLDCLISLLNKSVLVRERNQYEIINQPPLKSVGQCYLYDSLTPRKTGSFVYGFLQQYEADEKYKTIIDQHTSLVDTLIENLINKDKENFKNDMIDLSHFQYLHFADMITDEVKEIWMTGLKTKKYFFKLCGAGGGGYFLVYSDDDTFKPSDKFMKIT
ncbi:MAG: mevalonate kinase [Bdellovibrionales bacterium]